MNKVRNKSRRPGYWLSIAAALAAVVICIDWRMEMNSYRAMRRRPARQVAEAKLAAVDLPAGERAAGQLCPGSEVSGASPRRCLFDRPVAWRGSAPATVMDAGSGGSREISLCQALGPAAPYAIKGLDCATGACGELGWDAARPIPWQRYAQGEYVGHERLPHVDHYRLRVDDEIEFVFRLTRTETSRPYQLNVGDELRVESLSDSLLNRDLVVQPDGNITLPLINEIRATHHTIIQLREEIDKRLRKFYKEPAITVTPVRLNTRLEDLRATSDARFGFGGQSRRARVTPEGTIQLPALGSVPVQGLTLMEVKRELTERLGRRFEGMEIMPVLATRAPRYIYVLGEVRTPGRYELVGPTTAMQAISMAGSWIYGGNLWNVVVFRRGDDWRLLATKLDLRGPLYGKRPCPADEIWLNDSDIVLVPKSGILVADNIISLIFTQGLYGIAPFSGATTFSVTRFGTL